MSFGRTTLCVRRIRRTESPDVQAPKKKIARMNSRRLSLEIARHQRHQNNPSSSVAVFVGTHLTTGTGIQDSHVSRPLVDDLMLEYAARLKRV